MRHHGADIESERKNSRGRLCKRKDFIYNNRKEMYKRRGRDLYFEREKTEFARLL